MSEQFFRPTILLTDCPQDNGDDALQLVKGSGRSIEGLDIHAAVSSCQAMLHRFGGHAGAVGLTLSADNIERFRQLFAASVEAQSADDSLGPSIYIDMPATLSDLADRDFLEFYTSLAPFGSGNPEPVFSMKAQKLTNTRLVGTNHLRFTVMENNRSINGIGFGFGHLAAASQKTPMDLAFTLRLNSYMGQDKWELNLVDLRPAVT